MEYYKVRRSMYPVVFIVHSILLLACFSEGWESTHFLWGGTLGIRAEENPRPEPGAGEILGFHLKKLSGGHRGGRSGGR